MLQDDLVLKWNGVLFGLAIVVLLERRYRSMKKGFLAEGDQMASRMPPLHESR